MAHFPPPDARLLRELGEGDHVLRLLGLRVGVLEEDLLALAKEARNRQNAPLQEKFHRGTLRGLRNMSETL